LAGGKKENPDPPFHCHLQNDRRTADLPVASVQGPETQGQRKVSGNAEVHSDGVVAARDRQLLIARFFLLINQLSEADMLRFMNRYEQKRFSMLREFPRVPCNITLDLAADGRAINCSAMDISAGGMYVESCESFAMNQPVSICFSVVDDQLALKIKGRVIRLEQGGIGIKYESLTSYQIEIMKNMIDRLQRQASSQYRIPE
jgi:hypothetical protein